MLNYTILYYNILYYTDYIILYYSIRKRGGNILDISNILDILGHIRTY